MKVNLIKEENGFSFIEVVIALAILAILVVGMVSVFSLGVLGTAGGGISNKAVALAQDKMEEILNKPFPQVATTNWTQFPEYSNYEYKIDVASDSHGYAELREVTVSVRWTTEEGTQRVYDVKCIIHGQ